MFYMDSESDEKSLENSDNSEIDDDKFVIDSKKLTKSGKPIKDRKKSIFDP